MSKNEDTNSPTTPSARRSSFAGQRLSELFGRPPPIITGSQPFPGPITAAAHQANQKRRMSIASVGLGASPTSGSPFTPRNRQDSFSSNGSAPAESAIDDTGDQAAPLGSSPTYRRLSFGSRAMGQMSGGITNGRSQSISDTSPSSTSPSRSRVLSSKLGETTEEDHQAPSPSSSSTLPPSKLSNPFNRTTGESSGFNWSNEMRNRAQRSSSITSPTGTLSASLFPQKPATIAPAPVPPPSPTVKRQTPPDHFQERILKGDFYMD